MSVRNSIILITVIALHIGAIVVFLFSHTQVIAPQVITVSLVGSLIKPPAPSQQNAPTISAPTPVAIESPPALLEKPVVQEARPQTPSKPPPVVNSPAKPPTRIPPKPVTPPPVKPLPVVPPVVPAPSASPIAPTETQALAPVSPQANQTQAASAAEVGAVNEARVQGGQESSSDAVTAPSSNASYLNNAKPIYPPLSRRLKEEGTVVLRVLVSAQGTAKNVEVKQSSGFARLDQAALDAVRKWRFVPAKRGNTPIDMWYDVPVKFSLNS